MGQRGPVRNSGMSFAFGPTLPLDCSDASRGRLVSEL
jgi:hypothetical protein